MTINVRRLQYITFSKMFSASKANILHLRHIFWGSPSFGKALSRLVLGIETSCDETGAAVVDETGGILGESLHSQKQVHLRWVLFETEKDFVCQII